MQHSITVAEHSGHHTCNSAKPLLPLKGQGHHGGRPGSALNPELVHEGHKYLNNLRKSASSAACIHANVLMQPLQICLRNTTKDTLRCLSSEIRLRSECIKQLQWRHFLQRAEHLLRTHVNTHTRADLQRTVSAASQAHTWQLFICLLGGICDVPQQQQKLQLRHSVCTKYG